MPAKQSKASKAQQSKAKQSKQIKASKAKQSKASKAKGKGDGRVVVGVGVSGSYKRHKS